MFPIMTRRTRMAMEKEMPVTTMWMGMVQAWGCGDGWEIFGDKAGRLGVSELEIRYIVTA